MKYGIYKLVFPQGVHFGDGTLDHSTGTFEADTLFSALAHEALRNGGNCFVRFLAAVQNDEVVFTGGLPYIGQELMLPKPMILFESRNSEDSSTEKKAYKRLKYIPLSKFARFAAGEMTVDEIKTIGNPGIESTRTIAAVNGLDETMPFRVGTYSFFKDNGLYVIYGYLSDDVKQMFESLLEQLSYEGIGGERSSGLGRFELHTASIPEELLNRLSGSYDRYMLMSVALPTEQELDEVINGASYEMKKRSGFVSSQTYSDTNLRKKDLYVFSPGSVFPKLFKGDIVDVSSGGNHPVYRYARAFMIGV